MIAHEALPALPAILTTGCKSADMEGKVRAVAVINGAAAAAVHPDLLG